MKHFLLYLAVVVFLASAGVSANKLPATAEAPSKGEKLKLSTLQIPFVKNVGQADAEVVFYADTFGGALLVKKQGVLELVVPQTGNNKNRHSIIGETFLGARTNTIKGASPSVTKVSYFLGNKPEKWHSNIPTYEIVSMGDIYDGIELKLKAYGNNVEKYFHVRPDADPNLINVKLTGADSISVTKEGQLELKTKHGIVKYSKPKAYQNIENVMHEVEVSYAVAGNKYGFVVGEYDKSKELVIDPLLQSTYFGGGNNDLIRALGVSPSGDVYAVGHTDSIISGVSGLPLYTRDGTDAFVARFNANLTNLLFVGFIGDSPVDGDGRTDLATAVAFRPTTGGDYEVYIAGTTASHDLAGVTIDSADSLYVDLNSTGETEGFVSRFSSDLMTLHGSTYYGGAATAPEASFPNDSISALAVASILQPDETYRDEVFIMGTTSSTNLPGVDGEGSLNPSSQYLFGGGETDAFIARFRYELTEIMKATYLGGSGNDEAAGFALDSVNYFAGNTTSTDFPGVTAGESFQDSLSGSSDAFITQTGALLIGVFNSTYLGGSGDEDLRAIVDTGINTFDSYIFLAGGTTSTDFPGATTGTFPTPNNGFVAYIQKNLTAGTNYQATYLGGNGEDLIWDLALHEQAADINFDTDSVYITGSTRSTVFPGSTGGVQELLVGSQDAFVMRIDAGLTDTATYQMTYLGGSLSPEESGFAIEVDPISGVYVGGVTTADDFPGVTGGDKTFRSGFQDGFIARYDLTLEAGTNPEIRVTPTAIDFGDIVAGQSSAAVFISVINEGVDNLVITPPIVLSDLTNYQLDDTSLGSSCGTVGYIVQPGSNCSVQVTFTPDTGSADAIDATVTISSNDFSEPTVVVSLTGTGGSDSDGVPDVEEMGPLGTDADYDGNGDGIADRLQANAASLHSSNGGFYVTLATESGLSLEDVSASSNPTPSELPENIQTPYGFYSFTITGLPVGGTATATLTLNSTGSVTLTGDEFPDSYWKYGPQPPSVPESWYEFTFDGVRGAQFNDNVITLYFTDGRWGDHDMVQNGRIVDPAAPVKVQAVTDVPVVDGGGSSGLCFIATAAYGSYMHDDVKVLRDFRDEYLLTNSIGRKFVSAYYQYSPPIADFIRVDETRRMAARWLLTPLVYAIRHPYLALLLMLASGSMVLAYRQRQKMRQAG